MTVNSHPENPARAVVLTIETIETPAITETTEEGMTRATDVVETGMTNAIIATTAATDALHHASRKDVLDSSVLNPHNRN